MTQTTAIIVTVDHPSFAAVAALLSGTVAVGAAPKSEPAADAPAAAPKATRTKASAKPASEGSADTTTQEAASPATPSAGDAEANATAYLEVKQRILALSEKDRDAVVSVLKTYGVVKGSELTPDQYPAVIKDLDEALKPAEEEDDLS